MKKSTKKDKKETEQEKKERKAREKQEKKEKKEKKKEEKKEKKESKKLKKGSTTSLDSKGSGKISASNSSLSKSSTTTPVGTPGIVTKKTVIQEIETNIQEAPPIKSNGETAVVKKTTTITSDSPGSMVKTTVTQETTRGEDGELSTTTNTQETRPITSNGETAVVEKTTTVIKSEPETNKPTSLTKTTIITSGGPGSTAKTTVTQESIPEEDGKDLPTTKVDEAPTKTSNGEAVKKTTTTVIESEPKPKTVQESKTVVKATSNSSPGRKEEVAVTKTTSEVESIPTTREFLERNFPDEARLERTRLFQNKVVSEDFSPSVDKPSHFSQRTVIRETGDGERTEKTVTKIVSDEGGTKKTTTTTTSGGNGDHIISTEANREIDFPDWLEKKDPNSPRAVVDDAIKIPSPYIERKEKPRNQPTGPKVTETIQPGEKKKEDISSFLDGLSNASQEPPKDTKTSEQDNQITEIMDSLLESAPPKPEDAATDLEQENPPEKSVENDRGKSKKQNEVKKITRDDGGTTETVKETYKSDDGKYESTTTKTTKTTPQDKTPEKTDMNANILPPPEKPANVTPRSTKDKQDNDDGLFVRDDEAIDPDEVFEEIVVVQRKRKVRYPKSFLPRTPERPRSWALPLDVLIDRPKAPRRTTHFFGSEVKEQIDERSQQRSMSMQDLDNLLSIIGADN